MDNRQNSRITCVGANGGVYPFEDTLEEYALQNPDFFGSFHGFTLEEICYK